MVGNKEEKIMSGITNCRKKSTAKETAKYYRKKGYQADYKKLSDGRYRVYHRRK